MAETINNKNIFNEKSRLLNIALKYTNGDMERAKFMVSGQYNDVKIIKGKFDIEDKNVFGLLLIFLNIPNKYVMHLDSLLMSDNSIISKASIFDSWKSFYSDLSDFSKNDMESLLPSYEFFKYLTESLEDFNIYSEIENDNLEKTTEIINEIIKKFYLSNRINSQLNIDNTSSLNMELLNVQIEEPRKIGVTNEMDSEILVKINEIESKFKHVLNGRIIISPVKGKQISDVKTGDKIKVILTGKDILNIQIAKSLNALSEDNEILPLNMRIIEKFPTGNRGYYLYGLIAKNILVRVIEEEDVKIETDSIQKIPKASKTNKENSNNKTMIYIVLLTGLLFVILFFILIIL